MKVLTCLALASFFLYPKKAPYNATPSPELAGDGWRTDRAWYDGQAEMCVYEATRTIYGIERKYEARAYTNKQLMDPETTTKSTGSEGIEVFKHHWSERVPTQAYDYDFSTATFTRTDNFWPFKLTVATQEDCGASFKQATAEGVMIQFFESTYFPGEGVKDGRGIGPARDLVFEDALPLFLRNYPFESPSDQVHLLIPSQKQTRSSGWDPVSHTVKFGGKEQLQLPIGTVEAYRLDLEVGAGEVVSKFWFSTDGTAPSLHVLLKYSDERTGDSYLLKSQKRTAYWERG